MFMMLLIDGLHDVSREGWKVRDLAGMGGCFVVLGFFARCSMSPQGILKINQVCSSITPKFPVSTADSAFKGGLLGGVSNRASFQTPLPHFVTLFLFSVVFFR